MAVGGVEKNRSGGNAGEVESRNRNDYSQKEAELTKKHQAEISRLRQEQYDKMKALEAAYDKQLTEQQEASRQALTGRDIKYQQDIEEMRKLNRERMTALSNGYEDRLQRTRETTKSELESEKRTNDTQQKVMRENFAAEIQRKERATKEALENASKMQTEGMAREKDGIVEKHNQEVEYLRTERNDSVGKLQDDLRNTRREKMSQEKELKGALFKQKRNLEDNSMDLVMHERETANLQSKNQKEAFDGSLDKINRRHQAELLAERERNRENIENFSGDVRERHGDQITGLERRLKEAQEKGNTRLVENKRLNDMEKQHLYEEMQNNIQAAERSRALSIEDSNRRNSSEIQKMANQNETIFHQMDVRNKQQMDMLRLGHEEELAQKTGSLEIENDKLKADAEKHSKKMSEVHFSDRKNLEDYYKKGMSEQKRLYESVISEQRIKNIEERNVALDHLQKQMRQNEAKSEQKQSLITEGYERQIAELKTNHSKDIESVKREYDHRIKGDQKLAEQNLANQKLKYETQIANMKESYEEKLRQMEKNHQMDKIASTNTGKNKA